MAGCGCGSGAAGTEELWVNVKADGTTSSTGTKADAIQSQQINGGYLKKL